MRPTLPRNVTGSLFQTALVLCAVLPATTQTAGGSGSELQQKVAAVKQSVADNQQKLHQYQWTETTQITLKGDPKPEKQSLCQYGTKDTGRSPGSGAQWRENEAEDC